MTTTANFAATLADLTAKLKALRADIDAALTAITPAIPTEPARAPRPVCPLCDTDANTPMVERLILVPHTVHAACYDACDNYPEPGDAVDRLPDFVEEHMPDCDARSLRYAAARADLAERYPGILTIASAIRAAR